MNIDLVYGNSSSVRLVGTLIKTTQDAASVNFVVPKILPSGKQYALRTGKQYTPAFEITNSELKDGSGLPTSLVPFVDNRSNTDMSGAWMAPGPVLLLGSAIALHLL